MTRLSECWVSQRLTVEDMALQGEVSKDFLYRYERDGLHFMNRIITTDETNVS